MMTRVRDVDPKIKRLFPWALFLLFAVLFSLGAMSLARGQGPEQGITCEEVVKRVGLKPLWLAERQARRKYPDITDAQIEWGKQCVTDHRRAVLQNIETKVEGAFR
jgi:hypothetical protein